MPLTYPDLKVHIQIAEEETRHPQNMTQVCIKYGIHKIIVCADAHLEIP